MSATVPTVPALKVVPFPNITSVYLCAFAWYSPEKFKSISGSLSPLNPKNVSNGMSIPSFVSLCPHFGQSLSGKSKPFPTP